MINRFSVLLLIVVFVIISGCSRSEKNPISNSDEGYFENLPVSDHQPNTLNSSLAGIWTIDFDPNDVSVEIHPVRNPDSTWNVTGFLPMPSIQIKTFDPLTGILDVDLTVTNPTQLTGYDLRVIVFSDNYGIRLKNADDWTAQFDIPVGSIINPFKAYAKETEKRRFEGGNTSHTQRLQLYFPAGITMLDFAITASWPGNCDEPYQIKEFTQTDLYDYPGYTATCDVNVYDWQDDVSNVSLWCPPVTGVPLAEFSRISNLKWRLELRNMGVASPGTYLGVIIATSANSGSVALYDVVDIMVKKTPAVEGNAIAFGGTGTDSGNCLVIDNDGNMYVAGSFDAECDFHPGIDVVSRESSGLEDVFIVKYDQNWYLIWVQNFGGENNDYVNEMAIDGMGNLYIIGDFAGEVDFDPGAGTDMHNSGSSENRHIFLCKYDSNGIFQWANTWGGSGEYQAGYDVAVDSMNRIYAIGMFAGSCDFDPGSGQDIRNSASGNYDAFLSRFNVDGLYSGAVIWGGNNVEYGYTVDIDSGNNIISTGIFNGSCDFNPGSGSAVRSPVGYYDAYVLKLDQNYDFVWVKTYGGTSLEFALDVAIDNDSNIYLTGYFHGTTDLDPGASQDNHTSRGYSDIYLSKLNSDGIYQWGRSWGGSSDYGDYSYGITLDQSQNVYVVGGFSGDVDFDPGPGLDVQNAGAWYADIFICKYNPSGAYQWVNAWHGIHNDAPSDVEFYNNDYYMTGYFRYTIDFDPETGTDIYTSAGGYDAFLLRYIH